MILVWVLGLLPGWRVALVLLLSLLLETLVLLGTVVFYPALRVITPFGANSSEWGPIVLFLRVV